MSHYKARYGLCLLALIGAASTANAQLAIDFPDMAQFKKFKEQHTNAQKTQSRETREKTIAKQRAKQRDLSVTEWEGTPTVVFTDDNGALRSRQGLPPSGWLSHYTKPKSSDADE